MNLIEAKITAIIALGFGSLIVGLLPAAFSRRNREQYPLVISALLCFGGGVLLATSLVHMLPEIRESLTGDNVQYAELMYCVGFFLLYFIDELVHYFYSGSHNHHAPRISHNHEAHHSHNNEPHHSHEINHDAQTSAVIIDNQSTTRGVTENSSLLGSFNNSLAEGDRRRYDTMAHVREEVQPIGDVRFNNPSQLCHVEHREPCADTSVKSFGLIVALSIHAILEGLAVGLESSVNQVLLLLGAISTHKLVVAFCLGIELTTSRDHTIKKHAVSIAIFSFGSAAGIAIGMGISEIPTELTELALPILQALAAGTLLYVTVSEVLPRERASFHEDTTRKHAGLLQLLSVIVGFTVMTLLTKYMSD